MWLLGRLIPDYKSIAEFLRMHHDAVSPVGTAVTGEATDTRSLLPMVEAANQALENPETLNVVATRMPERRTLSCLPLQLRPSCIFQICITALTIYHYR
jgi:hypothetical protein